MIRNSRFPALAAGLARRGPLAASAQSAPATLTVQVSEPGAAVNKNMYGLFFEDINFAADGGLYPELRSPGGGIVEGRTLLECYPWKTFAVKSGTLSYTLAPKFSSVLRVQEADKK